jgi:hypothetical protein
VKYRKSLKKIVASFRKIFLCFIGEAELKSNTKKKSRKVCASFSGPGHLELMANQFFLSSVSSAQHRVIVVSNTIYIGFICIGLVGCYTVSVCRSVGTVPTQSTPCWEVSQRLPTHSVDGSPRSVASRQDISTVNRVDKMEIWWRTPPPQCTTTLPPSLATHTVFLLSLGLLSLD